MHHMTDNLIQRGHSWSVRYIIPTSDRAKIGKKEIVRALGTRDLDEARKLKHSALAKIIADVDAIVHPEGHLLKEAQEVALEILTVQGNSPSMEVTDESGVTHLVSESNADFYRGIVEDHVEVIEKKHGASVAQQYSDVALLGSMPISAARDRWLKSQIEKVTKGTVDGRRNIVSRFIADMGDMPVSAVTSRITTTWLSDYLEPSGRSPKTLAKYIDAMNLFWTWSRRREWCSGMSPFVDLKSELKRTESKKRAFTDEEMIAFISALKTKNNKHPEEYDVGILLLESSARLNEIAGLRVKHVLADREVHIFEGKNESASRCLFYFSDRAKAILAIRTAGKGPDEQVFHELTPGGQDEKLGHSLSKRMRATLAEAIPDAMKQGLDVHSIRRWGATVWESIEGLEDINRTLIKRAFGHNVGDLLGDIYSEGADRDRLIHTFEVFSRTVQKRVP